MTTTNKKAAKWAIEEGDEYQQFDIVSTKVEKINGRTSQHVLCTAYGEEAARKIAKDALELVAQGICDLRYIGTGEYVCDGACEKFADKTVSEIEHLDE